MAIERPYGRYILEERIALGGMAEIFRARTATEGFDKKVCIKRVLPHFLESPEFVTMFRDEARLAARLQHANVVQMFDFGEEDGTLYLAMELVDGADLKKLNDRAVRSGRRWSVGQALQIGIEMARGLHHAHTLSGDEGPLKIVHRDISPHNVLISRAGEVKVTDFGIAMAAEKASHTSTGVVKGKLSYMAPEQADGSAVDHRADQFATALVVWETLCGRKCFDGDNEAQVLRKVLTCEVMRPSAVRGDVPAAVDEILLKALAPTPAARFDDMRAFERALTRASFDLSDDPSFSDLRPHVNALLDDGANMRKTAVLDDAPAVAPAPADEASGVFTSHSEAKEALEQAGLAASGEVETVMAEATLVADSPLDASDVEAGDSTGPTKTIVPAEMLASDGDATRVDGKPAAPGPSAGAAFPRRSDPESVIPTEPVQRAPGPVPAAPLPASAGTAGVDGEGRRGKVAPALAIGALAVLVAVGVVAGAGGDGAPAVTSAQARSVEAEALAPADDKAAGAEEGDRAGAEEGDRANAPAPADDRDPQRAEGAPPAHPGTPPPEAVPAEVAPAREAPQARRRRRARPRAAKAAGEGKVFVNVVGSWAHVYRGKKKLGTTPTTITLPAGTQRLKLKNPETGREQVVKVVVAAGKTAKAIARW